MELPAFHGSRKTYYLKEAGDHSSNAEGKNDKFIYSKVHFQLQKKDNVVEKKKKQKTHQNLLINCCL
jgi:hypothetical protein